MPLYQASRRGRHNLKDCNNIQSSWWETSTTSTKTQTSTPTSVSSSIHHFCFSGRSPSHPTGGNISNQDGGSGGHQSGWWKGQVREKATRDLHYLSRLSTPKLSQIMCGKVKVFWLKSLSSFTNMLRIRLDRKYLKDMMRALLQKIKAEKNSRIMKLFLKSFWWRIGR